MNTLECDSKKLVDFIVKQYCTRDDFRLSTKALFTAITFKSFKLYLSLNTTKNDKPSAG